MSKRHAPREPEAQQALDPELKTEDCAERGEALEQLRGNQFARDALVLGAVSAGPVNDPKGILDAATDWMREEGAPEAELGGGEGEGGKATLDPNEDPPADLDDVAERIEDMADNGVPPEMPDDEGGGEGDDAPVMRSATGGGDDVDPEEVRPLIQASTGSPLAASLAGRLGRVLDHSLDHVMVHTDGKAAEAADKVHAHAFALGTHVFFAGGRYQPGTPGGDELLLHELTHVMQYDHGMLRGSSTGDLEVSKPGESAEMTAEAAASEGVSALRAADQGKPEAQVLSDTVHPIGRGSRPENQPMKQFMRGPVLETGVIFREEGEGQEGGQVGGDDNWVIAKVRDYSPQLADVLTLGVEEVFGDDLMTVIGEWLADMVPDIDLPGLLEDIMGQLAEAGSLLSAALAGDMECCKRIAEISSGITDSLAFLHSEEGPIKTFESYAQQAWSFLYSLGGGLFDGLIAANNAIADAVGLTSLRETVFGFIEWMGEGATWVIDEVLSAMGWPTLKEIPDALFDKAQGVVDAALEGHLQLVDAIAEAIGDTSWFNALADAGDLLVEAGQAAAWFAQNWGDESKWTEEALAENFLLLGDAMFAVREAWSDVQGVMKGGSELFASIQPKLQELVQHPIFCYLACWPLFTPAAAVIALTAYAGATFWADLWAGAQNAGSWLLWAGEGLAETIVAVTNIANPLTALPVLAGILLTFVSWLPDCYQEPIIDLFLLVGSAAGAMATLPFVMLGMPLAAVHHATMAFWEDLSNRSLEEKVAAFAAVAGILRLSFAVDLMAGFVVGALKGIWDEIVGIFTLIVGAIGLVAATVLAMPALVTALAAIMALSAKGQRDRREANEDLDPNEQDPEKVGEGVDTGIKPPSDDLEGKGSTPPNEPFDYPSLQDTMGGMWEAFEEGAEKMGSALADGVYRFLTSAEATAYTIGEWVGWGVAIIGFEFFLTKGASFLAGLLPKASKLLLKIVQLSEKIDDIIGSLLSPLVRFAGMVDDVLGKMVAYMRHIKLPFVDEVFDALVSMKTKIMAFFEELIEKLTRHLDELTKSKKGKPDAPGKKPDPNAPGKPKDGTNPDGTKKRKGEEDENLRLEATKRAQSLWPRVPDEDMDTTSDWNRLLAKRFDKRTSGLRFEHEASVSANTWSLKVTAIDGTRWGSATAGKGWRADVDAIDDQHARGPWLAKSDKASANKSTLQSSIQDLEAAWQDAYWLDTGFDEAIAKAIKGENKDLDAASYDETDLFVDGDLATTKPDVRLVASPNTTSVADTFYLDLTHRKYEEHYLAAVDLAFEEHFQDFKAPWTKHIEETVPTFDWNRVPDWAGGVEEGRRDAAPKIDAFFTEKSRRESRKNPWDERLRDLLFQEARSALFSPALERAMDQLEKLLEGDEELLETLDLDYDAALIYVGQTTGVSSKLVKAVESVQGRKSHQRILGFLQGLVEGKQFNGVGYREFADNSSAPHQASWYATDKSGRMENARWTKDRFRDAREGGPTSTGQHEWIPSNMIADMVTRDRSPSDAAETASWVDAQHELRTDTSFIVFPPTKSADLQQAWEDFVNQAQGSATPADFIEGRKVQASSFSLAGHTGALYLREDETRPKVPQTKGQGTFHDTLRNLVKASSTPDEYKTKLRKEVRSGKLIWNGKLAALTPDGWNEGDVKPIPIDYQGTKDVDLGKTLEAYGEHVRNTYRSVTDMLA